MAYMNLLGKKLCVVCLDLECDKSQVCLKCGSNEFIEIVTVRTSEKSTIIMEGQRVRFERVEV